MCSLFERNKGFLGRVEPAGEVGTRDAVNTRENEENGGIMKNEVKFIQLISSVVGLSLGVGIGTATVLLGVAALLQ